NSTWARAGASTTDGRMACKPHPANVPGPFYVEDGCCLACGVWEVDAPGLMAWLDDQSHCYVARQPETDAEFRQMLWAMETNEVDCLRVRGCKPEWAEELRRNGLGAQIDGDDSGATGPDPAGRTIRTPAAGTALAVALFALATILSMAALVLAALSLARASLPYNEQGRYFDAAKGVVYDQSAVLVYGTLALL